MATTLADLIAEVEDFLTSHGADRDKVCTLSGSLNNSATSFTVDDATQIDRGLVEIDYELIQVTSKNNGTGVVTVPAWGRGQRATTAAAHSSGARVAVNPKFPRSRIRTEINQSIANLFPSLFTVATDETNTVIASRITYPVSAAAEGVLKVGIQTVGPSKTWVPARAYRFDYTANTTEFPTGKSLDLGDFATPGRTIQIVYYKGFGALAADTDTLASVSVDDSWRDIITLDVCAKLVLALEPSKLQTTSVEQQNHAAYVAAGTGTAIARQMLALKQLRVDEERSLLLRRYPSHIITAF